MQQLTDSQLWDHLRPYVIRHVSDIVAGAASTNWAAAPIGAHDLGGPDHYGTLRLAQAPWAFATDGSRAITGNVTVASGITIDGIDISAHAADPNAHHNRQHSITSTSDHTVTGSAYQVLGASATNTLGLLTPLADVSGGTKEAILKSTSAGYLTTVQLTTTEQVATPMLTAAATLTIDPVGDVLFPQAQTVRSDNFTPGYPIVGWWIGKFLDVSTTLNAMQIHSLTLDELRTRIFVADEVRVDRGETFVTKSYGIVAADFVTPSALDGTVTITFDDSPAYPGAAIFTAGDAVFFRLFSDAEGFAILEIWGTVATYTDLADDKQSWVFTLKYGPTSFQMRRGMIAWDWGTTGQGYIHTSVVDTSGAPYIDLRTWTGAAGVWPTADPSPTFTTHVRIGKLIAALDNDLAPTGWGLFSDNAYLRGSLMAANVLLNDDGIRIRLPDISAWDDAYSIHFDREDDQEIFGGLYATWETEDAEAWDWQQYIHLRVYGADSYNAIYLDASSNGTGAGSIVMQAGLITDDDRPLLGLFYDPNDNLNQISIVATAIVTNGAITQTGHVIPSATSTYDLGSTSQRWRKIYVDEIITDVPPGEETLTGQTWQYDTGDMYIISAAAGTRTIYLSNTGAGVLNLDVDGSIVVGGTVDGVDIATLGSAYTAHIASANAHHTQAHVFATGSALGDDHTVSGLTIGHYIRATSATAAAFAAIVDGDLPSTIVRTSRNLATGSGLTGGGTLASDRSFDLADAVAGDGLSIASKVMAVELSATSGLELTGSSPAKTLQLADTVAGAGTTITDKVINVIAATNGGITVGAGDIGLTWGMPTISTIQPDDAASYGSSANPTRSDHKHAIVTAAPGANSVNLSASTEGTGTSFARADHTHLLDVAISPTWTGEHTFANNMVARHIRPQATDTYDLGTSTMLWRKGWLSELDTIIFAKNTVTLLGGWFYITKDAGTWPVDLAASASNVNVDFGEAMTVGDFLVSRSSLAVEYFKIYAFVSGTTYTLQRNLDGSGANAWPAGTPFAVFGQSGNGRIELNAYDTPRISLISQGATYNAQTELLRIGDLNGGWGYSGETYGFAVGERAASRVNMTLEATNGFRVFLNATQLAQWDATGNISVGSTAAEHVYITATGVQIKDGASVYTDLTGGTLTLGLTSSGEYVDISATNGFRIYGGALLTGQWTNTGKAIFGQVANSKSRIEIDPTNGISLVSRSAGGVDTTAISLTNAGNATFTGGITATSGSISGTLSITGSGKIDAGNCDIDTTGVSIVSPAAWASGDGYRFTTAGTVHTGLWNNNPGAAGNMRTRLMANSATSTSAPVYTDRNSWLELEARAGGTYTALTGIYAVATGYAVAKVEVQSSSGGAIVSISGAATFGGAVTVTGALKVGANTVWHAGNDGSGSTLDADLLDGQHGSYYRDASNINAGTLADARLPATMATKTINGLTVQSGGVTVAESFSEGLRTTTGVANPAFYVREKDNGASYGGRIVIGRNTNVSTKAAGALQIMDRSGTWYFVWPDDSGVLRIGTSVNTSANDLSGNIVGLQTSNLAWKTVVATPEPQAGFAAIQQAAAAVRDFTYTDGRYRDRAGTGAKVQRGIVVNYAPNFGLDYHPDYPDGKVLDEISIIGNLVLATAYLGTRVETQDQKIVRLERRVAELESRFRHEN